MTNSALYWAASVVLVAVIPYSTAVAGCSAGGSNEDEGSAARGAGGTGATGGGLNLGGGSSGGGPLGGVPQTCQQAVDQQSYIGCEYNPTVTSNSGLYDQFEFAIVVANPTNAPADVTVERQGVSVATASLAPGAIETIPLPWVVELKQVDAANDGSGISSALVAGGAYKVNSSVPVTVYQFNPLEFELPNPPADCPQLASAGACYSYSNDASLLLPTTALRTDYFVMSKPTFHIGVEDLFSGTTTWSDLPGFVAITATQDATSVTVHSTAYVRAGAGVAALNPGDTGTYTLNAGDVLMLESGTPPPQETPMPGEPCISEPAGLANRIKCPTAPEYDLTGSRVTSDKPVSVVAGHDCTFVPYSQFACDHIEESMFPVETLGQELMVTAPHSVAAIGTAPGTPDNYYVRVLSAADGNTINFEPAVSAPITLNAGAWQDIGPITQDFRVLADDKVMVAQYMVGENFSGESVGAGDPAISMAIPVEQHRVSYSFLAPATYTHNFVNIVAPTGTPIRLDGAGVPANEFTPIGASGMSVARHQISGGYHTIDGDDNFGIVVYGYGSYTSYMYPGGLNLETIVIVPN